jgi:hypothetical protein
MRISSEIDSSVDRIAFREERRYCAVVVCAAQDIRLGLDSSTGDPKIHELRILVLICVHICPPK